MTISYLASLQWVIYLLGMVIRDNKLPASLQWVIYNRYITHWREAR
jgi:hypothetical protein